MSETCAKWNLTYKGVATSLALGDLCYTFWGDYTKILTFNEGYDFCSSARQAWFPGTTGFDYGRLAVFQTPDMFKCVLESAATYTSSHYIMIGAHNRNGTANVLTDFLWGRTDRTDDGCNISNAFGKTNGKTVAPGPMVLVADVTRWVLEPHSENDVWYLPVFCEFGKTKVATCARMNSASSRMWTAAYVAIHSSMGHLSESASLQHGKSDSRCHKNVFGDDDHV